MRTPDGISANACRATADDFELAMRALIECFSLTYILSWTCFIAAAALSVGTAAPNAASPCAPTASLGAWLALALL